MDKKALILAGAAVAGLYYFRDSWGGGESNQSGNAGNGVSEQPANIVGYESELREYLKGKVPSGVTDKYMWWHWLKPFFGIAGNPPLPVEITYYGDTEQIGLDKIVELFKMFNPQVFVSGLEVEGPQ